MADKRSAGTRSNQRSGNDLTKRPKEFGGTLGAACMIAGLPIAILSINTFCNKVCTIQSHHHQSSIIIDV